MILLAFVGFASAGMAQDFVPVKKYSVATNSFWSNWFVSVGGHFNPAYTSQESSDLDFNPFAKARTNFGFNVAIGKWFTPGIGLRTKFEGLWNKRVINEDVYNTYKNFNIHEDVLFNLSNMLCGYNAKRVWNFIPWVGIGYDRNMCCDVDDISFQAGLLNNFRLCENLSIFLDIYATAMEGSNDHAAAHGYTDNWRKSEKHSLRYWDKNLGVALGLTFNLNKATWDPVPDVDALIASYNSQIDALKAENQRLADENARLQEMLRNQPKQQPAQEKVVTKTEKEYVMVPQSVFFDLNSSEIKNKKDLVALKELADYAKSNNADLLVTGYADSATGTNEINDRLSVERADAVKAALEEMGVEGSKISTAAKGGVDILDPASYNRRATVELK